MGLIDITPIGMTDDFSFGYCQGQRTCRANAYLTRDALSQAAHRLWLRLSHTVNLNRAEFVQGVREGYQDELAGTAHPLPQNDVPYMCSELSL
jgi:hypothetical protein